MDKKSGKSFLVGTAVGFIAGIATGYLTAPKSGKELRSDIKNKTLEAKEQCHQEKENFQSGFHDTMHDYIKPPKEFDMNSEKEELAKNQQIEVKDLKERINCIMLKTEEVNKKLDDQLEEK